jgi:hypothetical protein
MNTIEEIFANDKLSNFWPSSSQTHQENVFSTIRFILYASVLIYIITKDYRVVYLGLGIIAYVTFVGVEVKESYVDEPYPNMIPPINPPSIVQNGVPQTTPKPPDFSKVHPNINTTSLNQRFFKMPVNEIESLKNLMGGHISRKDTTVRFNGGRNGR